MGILSPYTCFYSYFLSSSFVAIVSSDKLKIVSLVVSDQFSFRAFKTSGNVWARACVISISGHLRDVITFTARSGKHNCAITFFHVAVIQLNCIFSCLCKIRE